MQPEMRISSSAYMGVETLVRLAVQRADTPARRRASPNGFAWPESPDRECCVKS